MGPGEVRLQVKSSGLCHTDFNEYLNGPLYVASTPHPRTGWSVPIVLGHEFSGEVIEIGPEVAGLRVGDRVAVNAVVIASFAGKSCSFISVGPRQRSALRATVGMPTTQWFRQIAAIFFAPTFRFAPLP